MSTNNNEPDGIPSDLSRSARFVESRPLHATTGLSRSARFVESRPLHATTGLSRSARFVESRPLHAITGKDLHSGVAMIHSGVSVSADRAIRGHMPRAATSTAYRAYSYSFRT